MSTLPISAPIRDVQNRSGLEELNIYNTSYLLDNLEDQIALLEGGREALAAKSFRSARFSLLKELSNGKPLTILSYEPVSAWEEDLKILERFNINVLFAHSHADYSLIENIKSNTIDIIYLASIHSNTLAVANHRAVIVQSHSHNIPVVYDNTLGALGAVYQPLASEADYVIANTKGTSFNTYGIGGYVVDGYSRVNSTISISTFSTDSAINNLKRRRLPVKKQPLLFVHDEKALEQQLNKEVRKHKTFTKNAFTVAKWLNHTEQVMEVNYPGLKTSDSVLNAENNFKGGYGKVLIFKLWEDAYSFNLLRSYFNSGRPKGFNVTEIKETKEFKIQVESESINEVLAYLQQVFNQLNKELEYKALLKKQLKLQKAVSEILNAY